MKVTIAGRSLIVRRSSLISHPAPGRKIDGWARWVGPFTVYWFKGREAEDG